ncbi:hypothetical protein CB1_001431017 [Camelus ferus]|nr:hypothetical protein CB1_001431017 [Camelus ferus]
MVAEMHGELIEFNERLHRALVAKEALVSQMRQELIDLRGPGVLTFADVLTCTAAAQRIGPGLSLGPSQSAVVEETPTVIRASKWQLPSSDEAVVQLVVAGTDVCVWRPLRTGNEGDPKEGEASLCTTPLTWVLMLLLGRAPKQRRKSWVRRERENFFTDAAQKLTLSGSLHTLAYAAPGVFAPGRSRNPGCSVSPALRSAFPCTRIQPPDSPDHRPDGELPSLQGRGEAKEDHAYSCSVLRGTKEKATSQRCVLRDSPGPQEVTRMFVASINRKLIFFLENLCRTLLTLPEYEVKPAF